MGNLGIIELFFLASLFIVISICVGIISIKALRSGYKVSRWVRWLVNLWWLIMILGLLFG